VAPSENIQPREHVSIVPLRKLNLKGQLYIRPPEIEAKLVELGSLSRDELLTRCVIREREDPRYVPSECILYFVRNCRNEDANSFFEQLYKILLERVFRRLPSPEGAGETETLTASEIRNHAVGTLVELLAADRNNYSEKLDYFEIRFDSAMARLRADACREVLPDAKRSVPLEINQETGELLSEVERTGEGFDPFNPTKLSSLDYRLSLDSAIDVLTVEKRRIVEMIKLGIPIDSKEPGVVTIAKTLGKSEKTVRTHRDEAFAELYAWLTKGEKP
jgi:hypothetical protein